MKTAHTFVLALATIASAAAAPQDPTTFSTASIPLSTGTTNTTLTDLKASLGIICNGQDISEKDYLSCRKFLIDQADINDGVTLACGARPKKSTHICEKGKLKVTGRTEGNINVASDCIWTVEIMQKIWEVCGSRGGSAPQVTDPRIIIHMNNFWV